MLRIPKVGILPLIVAILMIMMLFVRGNAIPKPTLSLWGEGVVVVEQDVVRTTSEMKGVDLNQSVDKIKKRLNKLSSVDDIEISYRHPTYYDTELKKNIQGDLVATIRFTANESDAEMGQSHLLKADAKLLNTTFMVSRTSIRMQN